MKGIVTHKKNGAYSGFMGNVMFQAAATMGIAVKNKMDYLLPPREYFKAFIGGIQTAPVEELSKLDTIDHKEKNYHYDEVALDPGKNYNLLGYYQSKKYWEHCEKKIRSLFLFDESIRKQVKDKYYFIIGQQPLIAVHVRRGDYLKHPNHHIVLPIEYYEKAVNEIRSRITEKAKVVVFSDDPTWCRQNFEEDKFGTLIFAEGNTQEQDMYFMTQCQHFVISPSSMSWWGSELSANKKKIIYAPKQWYGSSYAHFDTKDLYQPNWKLI